MNKEKSLVYQIDENTALLKHQFTKHRQETGHNPNKVFLIVKEFNLLLRKYDQYLSQNNMPRRQERKIKT